MSKKLTKEELIAKAQQIHGNKYDYSKFNYINARTPSIVICPIHGKFMVSMDNHVNKKSSCPYCKNNKKYTKDIFIEKANKTHNHFYDYSQIVYQNIDTKICIICPIHGEFWQRPSKHLQGQGCPKCKGDKIAKTKLFSINDFLNKAQQIHKDKYDYSKVEYINSSTKILIICPIHGEFMQTPNKHLLGQGCPYCANHLQLSRETFIEKSNQVHNKFYDYSNVIYKNLKTKIKIICPIHGEFEQTPYHHLKGHGCPYCAKEINVSESKLYRLLKAHFSFDIQREMKFQWLTKNKSLDIFIPQYNIAIEYQGEQHFKPIKHFGGEQTYEKILQRDEEKFIECQKNQIKLLYFTYLPQSFLPNDYFGNIYNQENILINKIKELIKDYENNT